MKSRSLLFLALGVAAVPAARLAAFPPPAESDAPLPAGVVLRPDVAYDASPRQRLDLYLPGGRPKHPRPVIVYVHDGGWMSGTKADGRTLALRFVAQGYAVACIDYRYSSDLEFPAQVEDCKAAVRWLRGSAPRLGLDPDHIGIIGFSAGGHLAALTGAMNSSRLYESGAALDQHSRVQAVVDLAGPVDLLKLYDDAKKSGSPIADDITLLVGGDPHLVPIPVNAANPTLFADVETPPYLIIHGDQDNAVPLGQSRLLYDTLVAKSLWAHLHVIRGAGHGGPAFNTPEITAMIDDFFTVTLKNGANPTERAVLTESTAAR